MAISPLPDTSAPVDATANALEVFSAHHLKNSLDNLMAPGVVVAGEPAKDAVTGCELVGGGIMVLATLEAQTVIRYERHHLLDLAADDVNVAIVLDGSGSTEVVDGLFPFRAGDILYLRASWAATLRVEEPCRMLILRLSFRRFSNGQRFKFGDFKPRMASRESPLREAAWNYVHQVLPSLADSSLSTVAHAEQAFISLLSAIYAQAQHAAREPAQAHTRWDLLVLAVDTMLSDPDLSVARLSAALGISTRRVHRLFEDNGHRYGAYLLEQRLERAREDLRRPIHADLGVAQVAYRCGFNSASHFSRCFKLRYGVAPSAYRTPAVT